MNLTIDIGNTFAKAAVYDSSQVVETFRTDNITTEYIKSEILSHYPAIDKAIITSTREQDIALENFMRKKFATVLYFDHNTPIPINNLYLTPLTLGKDRLAAAVGAHALYPEQNVLIVDLGTAITIDLLSEKGEFLGGNISPGANTRFRALNEFTGKLPLRALTEEYRLTGKNTFEAIEAGVINGIIFEIEGYIGRFSTQYPDLRIIFTGGDAIFFAKRLKNPIFATCDLVLYGLNEILKYNV